MKKLTTLALSLFFVLAAQAQVANMLGDWTTIDDNTGEAKSIVRISKTEKGSYEGQIIKLLLPGSEGKLCKKCEGKQKDQPMEGLVMLWGFHEDDGALVGGHVLDPESGKVYYAKLSLKNGKLCLRGSLDKYGMLGRNQTWVRK